MTDAPTPTERDLREEGMDALVLEAGVLVSEELDYVMQETPMSEPVTEAGRALLRDLWGAYAPGVERTTPEGEVTVRSRIAAIEVEAAAQAERPLQYALDECIAKWRKQRDDRTLLQADAVAAIEERAAAQAEARDKSAWIDLATERDMAEAYYGTLETHLRAHGCEHDFADVANGDADAALAPPTEPDHD